MKTIFKFSLEVRNDSPYFEEVLEEQKILLGLKYEYTLPNYIEEEELPVDVIVRKPYPNFITFFKKNNSFSMEPKDKEDTGTHKILLCLTDHYSRNLC